MLELDEGIFQQYKGISWFSKCGMASEVVFPFDVEVVKDSGSAKAELQSELWIDVRTQAQGDLTGYLAKTRMDLYGGNWNRLAKLSRERVEKEIGPDISSTLRRMELDEIRPLIVSDLVRISLHATFQKKVKGTPSFLRDLLSIYQQGLIPCGWSHPVTAWPEGRFKVF
jgi:hypothetical protein